MYEAGDSTELTGAGQFTEREISKNNARAMSNMFISQEGVPYPLVLNDDRNEAD